MSNNSNGMALRGTTPGLELVGKCNGKHLVCGAFVDKYKNPKTNNELTQELFHRYIGFLNTTNNYNSCVSSYNNNINTAKIVNFVAEACTRFLLGPQWLGQFMTSMSDTQLLAVFKKQVELDNKYVEKIISTDIPSGYGQSTFLSVLVTNYTSKKEATKYIFNLIPIKQFPNIISKFKSNITSNNEDLFAYYIKTNAAFIDSGTCQNLINNLPYRSAIINELFKIIISNPVDTKTKTDILNKAIDNIDKNLIMTIFESCKDIKPTTDMIDSLTKRIYPNASSIGASNSKIIADIVDIFVVYGMKITREIVVKLLNKTCFINNIEKYGIKIDEEILQMCANFSYYPYKYDIKPPKSVLMKECTKTNNIDTLKKLKEAGGIFTTECLIEACKNRNNGKVIRYLINDCGVKSNDECVRVFQETHHLEALDLIIKGYDNSKAKESDKTVKYVEIDPNSTLVIEPRTLAINNDSDYKFKSKIKKFFDYKKKTIKYLEVYEMMLKYLITKKLIIGNYFVINDELASILKLESCFILHIDQVKNIITYFIDLAD